MAKDDGGPAFSQHYPGADLGSQGMTLRDWFAGQALAGSMANPNIDVTEGMEAAAAYAMADAMLAERNKPDD